MPTYTVHAPSGRLSAAQKAELARDITRVHQEATGAPGFLAQVLFVDVSPKNWFVGGAPPGTDQIFLHGQVRAGRPPELKRALLLRLVELLANVAGCPKAHVWVYLTELPAAQMVEYGHELPEPGGEAAWLDGLPAADRARIESTGR
jgi:phenylpyruvate tautomerase PptA (4-oxalocrotonate tautomerase family)